MKISQKKKEKVCEQILAFLYSINPKPVFTQTIAQEIARDEEFVKRLLLDLKKENLVIEVKKNQQGVPYVRRARWKLTNRAYQSYFLKQPGPPSNS